MKNIYIITGGTMVHVTPHFSVCAPAYGKVGSELYDRLSANNWAEKYSIYLIKTKMAGVNSAKTMEHLKSLNIDKAIETNDELEVFVEIVSRQSETVAIVMAAAICDFAPQELTAYEDKTPIQIITFGKDKKRLHKAHSLELKLEPSKKIVDIIKKNSSEIFLVTFKATAGSTKEKLVEKALFNLKRSCSNLVFGNDIQNKINLIVTEDNEVLEAVDRASALDVFCGEFFRRIG